MNDIIYHLHIWNVRPQVDALRILINSIDDDGNTETLFSDTAMEIQAFYDWFKEFENFGHIDADHDEPFFKVYITDKDFKSLEAIYKENIFSNTTEIDNILISKSLIKMQDHAVDDDAGIVDLVKTIADLAGTNVEDLLNAFGIKK
jgi:hypothetical protein